MARGRMINQTIDYDAEFNALSIEAQLFYLRALAFLDRDGLIFGHPRALLAKVAPLLDFSNGQILDIIDEWLDQGLVIRYTAKVGDVLFFKGFAKNQSGMHYDRESPSRFDPPPGWTYGPKGLIRQESEPTPPTPQDDDRIDAGSTPTEPLDDSPIDSGTTPAEVRQESGATPTQIEVKDQDQLKEKLDDEDDTPARDAPHQTWFDTYQEEMPENIEKAIAKELVEYSEDAILHGIRASVNASSRSFKYLKNCVVNYIPPAPPTPQNANYANGYSSENNSNGRYSVDVPGVHVMQPTGNAPPLPPPMAHDDPWAVALSEMAATLTPTVTGWLQGSTLTANGELAGVPFYRVTAMTTPGNVVWLRQQAEKLIRKTVGSIVGKRIELEIVAAEQEPTP